MRRLRAGEALTRTLTDTFDAGGVEREDEEEEDDDDEEEGGKGDDDDDEEEGTEE
jgi:hypothetical protein